MGTGVLPEDIARAHAGSTYEVILGGAAHAVAGATLRGGAGGAWPTILASMLDASALPGLTGTMLGPSAEPAEIGVRSSGPDPMLMRANLTGYSQQSGTTVLSLAVLRAERLAAQ